MKELKHLLMNILSSYYNFRIIEYLDEENNNSWGLIKDDNKLNTLALFMERQNLSGGYEDIFNYVIRSFPKLESEVHIIIIDKYNNLLQFIESQEHPYSIENVSFDFILIEEDSNKVVYYDETACEMALLISSIITRSMGIKNKNEKKEKASITNVLILINVLVFLITAYLSGSIIDIDGRVLLLFGAKQNDLINNGEYFRLFTAMFLHGGLIHIGFNMYALKSLGSFIERIYGKAKFLVIYFLGGLTSSLFSYLFSDGMSVGASGAIFALLGCAVVYGVQMKNRVGKDFLSNILQVIGINLILGFTVSNIDNYGHIGGLIGGIIVSLILSLFHKK